MPTTRQTHLRYLRYGDFTVPGDCTAYTDEEYGILRKFGHWMDALVTGQITTLTPEQDHFILVDQGKATATSIYEIAWMKFKDQVTMLHEQQRKYRQQQQAAELEQHETRLARRHQQEAADREQAEERRRQHSEAVEYIDSLGIPESDEDRWW